MVVAPAVGAGQVVLDDDMTATVGIGVVGVLVRKADAFGDGGDDEAG